MLGIFFVLENDGNMDEKPSDPNSTEMPNKNIRNEVIDIDSSYNAIEVIGVTQKPGETIISIPSEECEPFLYQKEDEKGF